MKAYGVYQHTSRRKENRIGVSKHILIAEKALGKRLPKGAEVHHVDGNRSNNDNSNLVICQDKRYHHLLHRRHDIQEAGYNPNTHLKCTDCKEYKDNGLFSKNITRSSGYNNLCKSCDSVRNKDRYYRSKLLSNA